MTDLPRHARDFLVSLGAQLPEAVLAKTANYFEDAKLMSWLRSRGLSQQNFWPGADLELISWLHAHDMYPLERATSRREELWEIVAREIGDQPVCYLEFGVHEGAAIRVWSGLLTHPDSVLHGFDSFEGLPEPWLSNSHETHKEGFFSTEGRIPEIEDPRVTFHKGWFTETLPNFRLPAHDLLVLNMDADLYSSTRFVLSHLRPQIKEGVYIYFDEFSSRGHEEKAFREFVDETGLSFETVGGSTSLWHMLVKCTG